jgi:beta-glucanase (GH16 family)
MVLSFGRRTSGGRPGWAGRPGLALAGLSLALVGSTIGLAALVSTAPAQAAKVTTSAVTVPPAPRGFALTWSDDFNGRSGTGVNARKWKYNTGPGSSFGTGEVETMTSSTANVYQDGAGHLVLKARHSGTDPQAGWTSGRIQSQEAAFGAADGGVVRIESSIQKPNVTSANGAGYWPAFWLLGPTPRTGIPWPSSGEIGIMADINGRNSVFAGMHCGINPGGPCNEPTGLGSGEQPCLGCWTGFHTYAVEIDRSTTPEQIRWYLDGANYFTVTSTAVDASTWAAAVHHPFFIIYDLAIGGGFPEAFGVARPPRPSPAAR